MPTVKTDIDDAEKERLERIVTMLDSTQKDIIQSMVLFCLNEEQDKWRSYFLRGNFDDFSYEPEVEDDWDDAGDLNEAVRPSSSDDVIEDDMADEQLEVSQDDLESTTIEDLEDEIDDL